MIPLFQDMQHQIQSVFDYGVHYQQINLTLIRLIVVDISKL